MHDKLLNLAISVTSAANTTTSDCVAESLKSVCPISEDSASTVLLDCTIDLGLNTGARDEHHANSRAPTAISRRSNVVVFSCGDAETEQLVSPDQSTLLPGLLVEYCNNVEESADLVVVPCDIKLTGSEVKDESSILTAMNDSTDVNVHDSQTLDAARGNSSSSQNFDRDRDDSSGFGSWSDFVIHSSRSSSSGSQIIAADDVFVKLQSNTDNATAMRSEMSESDIPPVVNDRKILVGKRKTTPRNVQVPIPDVYSATPMADDLGILKNYIPTCLKQYGFCVFDGFLGQTRGHAVADEIRVLHDRGVFLDGQLTTNAYSSTAVRGDRVFWLENENSDDFVNVRLLLRCCDNMVQMLLGRLKPHSITSRTKV